MKRALAVVERKLEVSETKRETELARHLSREDELLNRCLTAAGKYALTRETQPLPEKPSEPEKLRPLTAEEEAEREFFAQDAVAANRTADEGRALWDDMHAKGMSAITMDGEQ
jgi:hypothetical protein